MGKVELTRGERFAAARTELNQYGNQSMAQVSKATGVSQSMISALENDDEDRGVKYQHIAALAKHYGVSADYLLGLSEYPTLDKDLKAVCEYTGLDEEAVKTLHEEKERSIEKAKDSYFEIPLSFPVQEFINRILEDNEGYRFLICYNEISIHCRRIKRRKEYEDFYKGLFPDSQKSIKEQIEDLDYFSDEEALSDFDELNILLYQFQRKADDFLENALHYKSLEKMLDEFIEIDCDKKIEALYHLLPESESPYDDSLAEIQNEIECLSNRVKDLQAEKEDLERGEQLIGGSGDGKH